jgi:hypothetical protein
MFSGRAIYVIGSLQVAMMTESVRSLLACGMRKKATKTYAHRKYWDGNITPSVRVSFYAR